MARCGAAPDTALNLLPDRTPRRLPSSGNPPESPPDLSLPTSCPRVGHRAGTGRIRHHPAHQGSCRYALVQQSSRDRPSLGGRSEARLSLQSRTRRRPLVRFTIPTPRCAHASGADCRASMVAKTPSTSSCEAAQTFPVAVGERGAVNKCRIPSSPQTRSNDASALDTRPQPPREHLAVGEHLLGQPVTGPKREVEICKRNASVVPLR
jgi:hypothetical protein